MNYLVTLLFSAIITFGCIEGGLLNTNKIQDSNPSHKKSSHPPTASTSADSVASASSQGWSPSAGYLPASPGSLGYRGPIAVPMILSDGTIAETVEVAAARAAHLAALAAARASDPDMGRDDGEYDPKKYGDHLYGVVSHSEDLLQSILSYQALAKGGAPSVVYGTPGSGMQSLAKAMTDASAGGATYGAPAPAPVYGVPSQSAGQTGSVEQNTPYLGPLAMLQLLASGFLADTPEVIAARNTHLKALQEAQAAADLWRAKQGAAGAQAHPWG